LSAHFECRLYTGACNASKRRCAAARSTRRCISTSAPRKQPRF
jgi:hypothetical protein